MAETMGETDLLYLQGLCASRDASGTEEPMHFYYQGRIDEYCRQNALDQHDLPPDCRFDLNLPRYD